MAVDLEGELATHRHTGRRRIRFCSVELRLSPALGWPDSECRLVRSDGSYDAIACAALSALSADGGGFPLTILCDGTIRFGPADVGALLARIPDGANCFAFDRLSDGSWNGTAISLGRGGVSLRPYRCDPT